MSIRYAAALAVAAAVCSPAAAQTVKYEKYKLDNGLTVILHEDHSLPIATINLWYYVGSKDEAPGRSGFAHLFEHLMFMGTERVPDNQFDVLMEEGGGFNNASTSYDRTNYYSFGPSSLLPTLLWLDADRMEALGVTMTQEKLDKQREVVRNERRQTSEMQPYGVADLKISELMYPPGHPYHMEVIGSHEDLQAATVQDVKDFFATFYVPNNCSLVVAGDFDPQEIKPLIARLFGGIPRDADPLHAERTPVALKEVKRVTYSDDVQFPRITFVYHSPPLFEPGDAEMDLAASILGSGKSSRLYKRLIYDERLANSVSAVQYSGLLGSTFHIEVNVRGDVALERIESAVDEVIAEFSRNGPTADELERQKASFELGALQGMQSLMAKADALNRYEFHYGEPDSFKRDLDRYRNATTGGVRDWAAKVLTPDARLIMRVLPESQAAELAGRDERPAPAAGRAFEPTAPSTFTLSNGVKVYHWQRPELPLIYVSTAFGGGAANLDGQSPGLADLTADMLDEGAGERDALQFADALDQIGATFSAGADAESTTVDLTVLKRSLTEGLALYADALLRPRFDEKEWDRVRALHLQGLKRALDRAPLVAGLVGQRVFFGDDHPLGRPVSGTPASVEALNLADLKALHAGFYAPANASIYVAGDITADEARAALEKALAGWSNPANVVRGERVPAAKPPRGGQRVYLVDKPGSEQTVIRFYMPGPKFTDPQRVPYELLSTILGGSFTSRLNQNLRERNGYTYGARARYAMSPTNGYLLASADVQTEVTGPALKEFLYEFQQIRADTITPEEAGKARETYVVSTVRDFEGLRGLVSAAQQLDRNGLPFSTLGEDLEKARRVAAADLSRISKAAVPIEDAVLILVGDREKVLEQIRQAGLPAPIELTVTGEPAATN